MSKTDDHDVVDRIAAALMTVTAARLRSDDPSWPNAWCRSAPSEGSEDWVEAGTIHRDMTRRDAQALVNRSIAAPSVVAWNGTVHPVHDLLPGYEPWAKLSLARDIKRHGLFEPGVLLPDGTMLDGRERREACELVAVRMRWEVREFANDEEVALFVLRQSWQRPAKRQVERLERLIAYLTHMPLEERRPCHDDDLVDLAEMLEHTREWARRDALEVDA